ncbi:NAD-P-binding protein [Ceratobasidium sp. AG-I]|nr:NAD-P-binding protein [Ceratobasidium sp. AG-I]
MGVAYSMYNETFPPKPQWTIEQIPDLTGQVIIVTGGNAGIGKETCKVLLEKGAKVYMAARSKSKANEAIEWIQAATNGKTPVFLELDLANLDSVRRAANEFRQKEQELHVLFNNGGVMAAPVEMKTSNGYDLQFGTNVLGHYLFTMLLLPTLIHTAQSYGPVRVVNTSSSGHWLAPEGGINYDSLVRSDPKADEIRERLGPKGLYSQSKWANIVFAKELARQYEAQGIISSSLHPGAIRSELMRHSPLTGLGKLLLDWVFWPTPYGAITQLYAGTAVEGLEFSGQYLSPFARLSKSRADTQDEEAAKKLWTWLEEQVKLN